MQEVWRPVVGLEERYLVSSEGKVRSLVKNRLLKLVLMNNKYLVVCLRGKTRYVHQLVAEAFHGPRPEGMQCCHINDNGQDNRACNLYWGTPKQNTADSIRNGTSRLCIGNKGEDNYRSKLDEGSVRYIRYQHANGRGYGSLSKELGVSKTAIAKILQGRAWTHVA